MQTLHWSLSNLIRACRKTPGRMKGLQAPHSSSATFSHRQPIGKLKPFGTVCISITQDQEGPESVLKKLRIFSGKRIFCGRRWCCIRWHTVLQTLQTHQYFWRIHIHFGRTQKFLECDLNLTTCGGGKWICSSTISSAILLPASLHAPSDLVSVCWLFSISRGSLNYSGNPTNALWSRPQRLSRCFALCSLGDIIWGIATERQISFTEAGAMASWKNPIKKKKKHLWSSRRTGWKRFIGFSLQCVLLHSLTCACTWNELCKLRTAASLLLLTVWSNSLGFKWYWVCFLFVLFIFPFLF